MGDLTLLDVTIGGQGEKFADLLCIKREAFEHEKEVRLLFQDLDPKRGAGALFRYKLNANCVFEEVVLDPRLKDGDASALKSKLLSAGCTLMLFTVRHPEFQIRHSSPARRAPLAEPG